HMLKEPKERVREASRQEEVAIFEEIPEGYDAAVRFALLSGCRLAEIVNLEWSCVDFFARQFTVTGKGEHSRTIPMSESIFNLLWAEQGNHGAKVFTYVAQRTDRRKK